MQSALSFLRKNLAYTFVLFGAVWVVIAFLTGSALVLWPAVACVAAGLLIRVKPSSRLSEAWGPSAAVLGFVLCVYQVYAAILLLGGSFVTVAASSLVIFLLLGLGHMYLAFASYSAESVK
ncbi:MAG: hypothetical protein JRM80_09330 [Nitrososphaerota archaeon]|nr:hypothetical protein [Nitrososphaerota archaeon]